MAQPPRFAARSSVIRNTSLSFGARALYALMDDIAGEKGSLWPRQAVLAEMVGTRPRTLRFWIAELTASETVWIDRQRGASRYVLGWLPDRQRIASLTSRSGKKPSSERQPIATLFPLSELRKELNTLPIEGEPETPQTPVLCVWCHDTGYCGTGYSRGPCGACSIGRALRRRA